MLNVHVYNRHRQSCSHRSQRFWKKCDCPKWITWHRGGKEFRQSAQSGEWSVAQEKAYRITESFRETGALPVNEVTIEQAVRMFLQDRESQHLSDATIYKLRSIFEKQMLAWFSGLDIHLLRNLTLPNLQAWRSSWKDGPLAAKKKQERVRGFFYWCQRNKWIEDNPALGLSRIKAGTHEADYFTPEEFQKVYAAIDGFGKTEQVRDRMRGMVLLLRWSGLAIRDAVTLERDRLGKDDRLILRRVKTGVPVMLPLQTNVASFLKGAVKNENQRYFFWTGNGLPKSAVADWQRSLRRVFDLADLKKPDGSKKRCHPHMFRHTFSIEMLLKGVPIEDVARLLGHSSIRTTERYYSSFVKARADRLEEAVMATWVTG